MCRIIALVGLFIASCTTEETVDQRPNIILIMGDDMGFSDLGCFGGEIDTPHLDWLAEHGLRYTQFYNSARCCPTRASLLTGLYPQQAGVGHMMGDRGTPAFRGDLSANAMTIAEVLKGAGYATYMSGKWHVTPYLEHDLESQPRHNFPTRRGFDKFFGTIKGAGSLYDPSSLTMGLEWMAPDEDFYYTDAITEYALECIKDHDRQRPFFMYVSHVAAHWPMHAHPEDIARFNGRYDIGWDSTRSLRLDRLKELGIVDPGSTLTPRDERIPAWTDDVSDRAWHIANMETYAAMVYRMDAGIGHIVEELKANKQLDNTLIFFLQDNGGCAEELDWIDREIKATDEPLAADAFQTRMVPLFTRDGQQIKVQDPTVMPGPPNTYHAYGKHWANVSNTPFRLYKHWVNEGGIATPLIAHWPNGVSAEVGGLCHTPTHLIDIMATCIDVGQASYPQTYNGQEIIPYEGKSLAPTFTGKSLQERRLFWEHEGNRAVRDSRWKLISHSTYNSFIHDRTDTLTLADWELYDMAVDRTETNNLAKQHPNRVKDLASAWMEWGLKTGIIPRPYQD